MDETGKRIGDIHPNYIKRLEEMQVYDFLKMLLNAADEVGSVKKVSLEPDWIPGHDLVEISGETAEGYQFVLKLEVVRDDDRN